MQLTSTPVIFAVFSNLAFTATAHMIFNTPATWGLASQGMSLETPLNMNTGKNWPHHGANKDTTAVITFNPGDKPTFPVTCGEASTSPSQAQELCKTKADVHGGGGCALSIAYTSGTPNPEDFIVFSVTHDCPSFDHFNHNFAIPANLPACASCVCAWHWVPDADFSADEMYMNTFNCAVTGETTGKIIGGRKPNYFGVVDYPGEGSRPMYKTTFPEGAQELQVGGGKAAKRWEA